MNAFIEIHITTETEHEAEKIAQTLLEKRLAACVQISGPIKSFYTWKGKREISTEWFCCVKSTQRLFPTLVEQVRAIHAYECPQIVAIPIVLGSDDYMQWMKENLS